MRPTVTLALTALLATGCPPGDEQVDDTPGECDPAGALTEAEAADVLWMREEEKVARDVYLALFDQYAQNPFGNISESEQRHMDAMLVLVDTYGLADPVGTNGPGVFTEPDLQDLHDTLLADGQSGWIAALEVGALIEETDIADIADAIDRTCHDDVATTYASLMEGSSNHLRAYVGKLAQEGVDYAPTVLDPADYEAILDGATGI